MKMRLVPRISYSLSLPWLQSMVRSSHVKEQDKVQSELAVLLQGARKVGEGQSKDDKVMKL